MPLSATISLPEGVQNQINSAALQYSVDSLVLSAIAQVMSGGQQFASGTALLVNDLGGVGIMGIDPQVAQALGFSASDPTQNVLAGAAQMARLLSMFTGNYPFAVAAYFSGVDAVLQYNGVPPLASTQALVYNVTNLARRAGSPSMSAKSTLENQTVTDPNSGTQTGQLVTPVGQSIDPNDPTQANSTQPSLQIDTGLGEKPWFDMVGSGQLVTGNPRIRQSVQPVSFTVYLSRNQSQFLHNPSSGKPITLELNTSMKSFELQSKHIFNRQPSRTGMHVTLWGMAPDLITGSGTTGVFMNQLGITDFFSVADVTDDMKQLVESGFVRTFAKNINGVQAGTSTGAVQVFNVVNSQYDNIVNKQAVDPNTAFRVAAQDAFTEFLKLFQMNGNVWFYSKNYNGAYVGQQQSATNAWSPGVGATSFEQTARNNDVEARGFVAMRYRNNIYLGYFKSFNWTQDAEKPFSWDFNFVFQVERTVSALYWPNAGVTQFSMVGQAVVASQGQQPVFETTPSAIEGTLTPPSGTGE
jgi:ribosomal protein S20